VLSRSKADAPVELERHRPLHPRSLDGCQQRGRSRKPFDADDRRDDFGKLDRRDPRRCGRRQNALRDWAAKSRADRAALIGDPIEPRQDELAATITREVGVPLKLAKAIQVAMPLQIFRKMAKLAAEFTFERKTATRPW
jgi:hypothetical protein